MQRHKYPSTPHLPSSPGATKDDVFLSLNAFEGKQVVVTRKMDGENFTGYSDGNTHARSMDGRTHWTRDWAKNYWTRRSYLLQKGYRVCAENLYAQHSITYTHLSTFLPLISVWNSNNECLSWKDTEGWAIKLNMDTVPVLYNGQWDPEKIFSLHVEGHEGLVVRVADAFNYDEFGVNVAKFMRPNHVQKNTHRMNGEIHKNGIDESSLYAH